MASLSWLRLTRNLTGLVRQQELTNLEALIDLEAERQPAYNFFILSCAIPAGIGIFGGGSVFVAWLAGNTGLPLILGSALTVALAAGAWFTFFRLYQSVAPAKRELRRLIMKLSEKYQKLGNIFLGEGSLSPEFAKLLDEAAGIYLRHSSDATEAPDKATKAIDDAMTKLLEVALLKETEAQNLALTWAQPMLEEMRMLDKSLTQNALASKQLDLSDPLANLREARAELETSNTAIQELEDHLKAN